MIKMFATRGHLIKFFLIPDIFVTEIIEFSENLSGKTQLLLNSCIGKFDKLVE